MSLRRMGNITTVTLSDSTKLTSALPAVGTVVTPANLEKGAVVLTDVGLRRLNAAAYTALASTAQIFIIQGRGASLPLLKSPVLTKGTLVVSTSKHKPKQEQISVVGYNPYGSPISGALPIANNTTYFIKIRKNDNDAANRSQPQSLYAQFKTDASGTQEELAFGLVKNAVKNLSKEPANGYVAVSMLCDEAGSANTGAGTITLAKGSKTATFGTDVDAVAVVGGYIRFDESVGAAPALTDAVYKIMAMNTTTQVMTLDRPYTGTSMSGAAVGNAVVMNVATAAVAEFGIRFEGVPASFDVNKFRDYYANRFTVSFSDDTTLVSHVQGAFNGNGVWQQVAMDEYLTYGFEGMNEMTGVPPTMRPQEVKTPALFAENACKYSALQLNWTESISGLVSTDGGKGSHLVYLNLHTDATLAGTANTGVELVTALGLTAATFNQ